MKCEACGKSTHVQGNTDFEVDTGDGHPHFPFLCDNCRNPEKREEITAKLQEKLSRKSPEFACAVCRKFTHGRRDEIKFRTPTSIEPLAHDMLCVKCGPMFGDGLGSQVGCLACGQRGALMSIPEINFPEEVAAEVGLPERPLLCEACRKDWPKVRMEMAKRYGDYIEAFPHAVKQYACPDCGAPFATLAGLWSHTWGTHDTKVNLEIVAGWKAEVRIKDAEIAILADPVPREIREVAEWQARFAAGVAVEPLVPSEPEDPKPHPLPPESDHPGTPEPPEDKQPEPVWFGPINRDAYEAIETPYTETEKFSKCAACPLPDCELRCEDPTKDEKPAPCVVEFTKDWVSIPNCADYEGKPEDFVQYCAACENPNPEGTGCTCAIGTVSQRRVGYAETPKKTKATRPSQADKVPCPVCKKKFTNGGLSRHMKNKHPDQGAETPSETPTQPLTKPPKGEGSPVQGGLFDYVEMPEKRPPEKKPAEAPRKKKTVGRVIAENSELTVKLLTEFKQSIEKVAQTLDGVLTRLYHLEKRGGTVGNVEVQTG